jgi:hypothetical protein
MKLLTTAWAGIILLGVGCGTHVYISETHREDIATRSRVMAIAAGNLDDNMRSHTATPAEQQTAEAAAKFHNAAENFARAGSRWVSTENVNDRYEQLIDTWVKLKESMSKLKLDSLTTEVWQRVVYEWDRLGRATGYSGTAYEKERGKRK